MEAWKGGGEGGVGCRHGLINYIDTIDTKAKCPVKMPCNGTSRHVFIRVYRLEIQSVMLVFSTQLCEPFPLDPSLWLNFPPPPPSLCE